MNRLRADFVLLLVAFIWGSAFVVQRIAGQYFNAFTFNGLRFILGGLIMLPFSKLNPLLRRTATVNVVNQGMTITKGEFHLDRKSYTFMVLAGFILFTASALQQLGLETTTAGNAGFITTLYVVLVPIILLIFFREKIHWISWVGAGIAILGSFLLSTGGKFRLTPGDAYEMAGSLFWALHVIVVSHAVKHVDLLSFSVGQYLVAGIFNMIVSVGLNMPLTGLATAWWTIVYIAVFSTAIGYTLQGLGQKYAPPTDATILMSMEAVFAASLGFIILGETMVFVQLLGCGMIILAVLLTQLKSMWPSATSV
jgi:drug/metabolite transporter (DMT)-like permease